MTVSTSIKNTIIERINNLASVQSVYGYERNNLEGFPAVIVVAANLEGEFTSTTENRRVYGYNVTVLMSIGQTHQGTTGPKNETAENVIADVVDDIIDDMDKNFELSDNANVLYVDAADAEWGFVEYEGGVAKACQITLLVNTDFNVNT